MSQETAAIKQILMNNFLTNVHNTADDLRYLANKIENEAKVIEKSPSSHSVSASAVSASIIHSVMWGLANANVNGIVSAAAQFDQLILKENPND